MTKKTPEQRSLDRYPDDAPPYGVVYPNEHKRDGYATCIREEVEPLEEERDRLRAFIDKFIPSECWGIDAFDGGEVQDVAERMGILVRVSHTQPCQIEECNCEGSDYLYSTEWTAKQEGFVPTNTEDQ